MFSHFLPPNHLVLHPKDVAEPSILKLPFSAVVLIKKIHLKLPNSVVGMLKYAGGIDIPLEKAYPIRKPLLFLIRFLILQTLHLKLYRETLAETMPILRQQYLLKALPNLPNILQLPNKQILPYPPSTGGIYRTSTLSWTVNGLRRVHVAKNVGSACSLMKIQRVDAAE